MIRLSAALLLTCAVTMAAPVFAQTYPGDAPAPAGIDAQPLPAITPSQSGGSPMSLMSPPASNQGTKAVTSREGPQERELDQSLGLPQASTAPAGIPEAATRPSAKTDAEIEARINAARTMGAAPQTLQAPAVSLPMPPKMPVMPPTTIVGGSVSHPANVAPAPTHWEGPDERALDQADPLSAPPLTGVASQDPETRRLNGGN